MCVSNRLLSLGIMSRQNKNLLWLMIVCCSTCQISMLPWKIYSSTNICQWMCCLVNIRKQIKVTSKIFWLWLWASKLWHRALYNVIYCYMIKSNVAFVCAVRSENLIQINIQVSLTDEYFSNRSSSPYPGRHEIYC